MFMDHIVLVMLCSVKNRKNVVLLGCIACSQLIFMIFVKVKAWSFL